MISPDCEAEDLPILVERFLANAETDTYKNRFNRWSSQSSTSLHQTDNHIHHISRH